MLGSTDLYRNAFSTTQFLMLSHLHVSAALIMLLLLGKVTKGKRRKTFSETTMLSFLMLTSKIGHFIVAYWRKTKLSMCSRLYFSKMATKISQFCIFCGITLWYFSSIISWSLKPLFLKLGLA